MNEKKSQIIADFDPNGVGQDNTIFGLPFDEDTSEVIILPVPWEVTVSYRAGTAKGPAAIKQASLQVDLFQRDIKDAWQIGIFMKPIAEKWQQKSKKLRKKAAEYIEALSSDEVELEDWKETLERIEESAEKLRKWTYQETEKVLKEGKLPVLVGGDHSTPLGAMQAVVDQYPEVGILQIDAHCDFRKAYEDFQYSHASISYNLLETRPVKKMVQVGIRDYCEEEQQYIDAQGDRVAIFFDDVIKHRQMEGETWQKICQSIIAQLPEEVYITFDIDGLSPTLCPNTGTPVPGGFQLAEMDYLFQAMVKAGKKIVGFDLVEVAPAKEDEWDGNVGARLLYRMCNLAGVSQGKLNWA